MKIISISAIEGMAGMIFDGDMYLLPVQIIARKWYGVKYKFNAYPTHVGVVGKSGGNFLYHYYCDEFGKNLSDDVSLQICNYMLVYQIKNKSK